MAQHTTRPTAEFAVSLAAPAATQAPTTTPSPTMPSATRTRRDDQRQRPTRSAARISAPAAADRIVSGGAAVLRRRRYGQHPAIEGRGVPAGELGRVRGASTVRPPLRRDADLRGVGDGKSTLLDAYIALMMPSDTPFNGASNDAVAGRARSSEQCNLLSYQRGQTDTTADDHGRERPKVLRGDRRSTWGAVAMTFIDDHGRRFTALRVLRPGACDPGRGLMLGCSTPPQSKPGRGYTARDGQAGTQDSLVVRAPMRPSARNDRRHLAAFGRSDAS